MRTQLELLDTFGVIATNLDALELLKSIKNIVFNFQSQKYKPQALHEAKRRFYVLSQDRNMTVQVFLERYQNNIDVIEHCGGSIGVEPILVENILTELGLTMSTASTVEATAAGNVAQESYLASAFLLASDRTRYGKLLEDLENDYLQGRDNYPKTLTGAYNLLVNWKQNPNHFLRFTGPSNDGVAFTNTDGSKEEGSGVALATDGKNATKESTLTLTRSSATSATSVTRWGTMHPIVPKQGQRQNKQAPSC
jgi:hypothetical protein